MALKGDKDLNSPRILSAEAEKELHWVENRKLDAHVYWINIDLDCILVILLSREYPSGILMQREDTILEWIFLPHKQNKTLKTYIEKICDLILQGKLRLRQLTGKDPAEIIIPLVNKKFPPCERIINIGKQLLLTFWEQLATTIPKLTELNS